MNITKQTITKGNWRVVLDASEIVADNPGEGTPAMVYGRVNGREVSGTFACVLDTQDCDGEFVPASIHAWLESLVHRVDSFLDSQGAKSHIYR